MHSVTVEKEYNHKSASYTKSRSEGKDHEEEYFEANECGNITELDVLRVEREFGLMLYYVLSSHAKRVQ